MTASKINYFGTHEKIYFFAKERPLQRGTVRITETFILFIHFYSFLYVLKNKSKDKHHELFQVPVVQRADNFIQHISRYPADKMYWLEYILSAG